MRTVEIASAPGDSGVNCVIQIVEVDGFRPSVIRQQAESRTELATDLNLQGVVITGGVAAEIEDIRSIGVEWSPQRNFCFAINVAVIRKILLVNRGIIFAICRISQFGRLLSEETRQRRLIQVIVRQ